MPQQRGERETPGYEPLERNHLPVSSDRVMPQYRPSCATRQGNQFPSRRNKARRDPAQSQASTFTGSYLPPPWRGSYTSRPTKLCHNTFAGNPPLPLSGRLIVFSPRVDEFVPQIRKIHFQSRHFEETRASQAALQGYLAHKKQRQPRTLQQGHA